MEVGARHDGFCDSLAMDIHDVVWVIVERLTKLAHFLAVRMAFTKEEFCKLHMREII